VISGFSREVYENCAVPCYYAASSCNSLVTFQYNVSVPSSTEKRLLITQNSALLSFVISWDECGPRAWVCESLI